MSEICVVDDCEKNTKGFERKRPERTKGFYLCSTHSNRVRARNLTGKEDDFLTQISTDYEDQRGKNGEDLAWNPEDFDTFQNTAYPVIPYKNRVKGQTKATCAKCQKQKTIVTPAFQFCISCSQQEQYVGESCGVCDSLSDGTQGMFKSDIMSCSSCHRKMRKYKLNLQQLKALLAIKNCQVCQQELTHDNSLQQHSIDHDHETGIVRGVLCGRCNRLEGKLNKLNSPDIFTKNLVEYLKNPPLVADQIHVPKLKKLRNKE